MKLIFCKRCKDVFSLNSEMRTCLCGESRGKYFSDGLNAEVLGDYAVPVGFQNPSFFEAVVNQPEEGMGLEFIAFVIPKRVSSILRK